MTIEKTQIKFNSRRSAVYGMNGMVSSLQAVATQIGLDVLKKGGNAIDAGVAVAFALGPLEPISSNVGGNALCLYYDANKRKVTCIDGSGRTSSKMTLEHVLNDPVVQERNSLMNTIHGVTVPGAPAALIDTLALFGSGKFDLPTLMEPAIDLAENGFPMSEATAIDFKHVIKEVIKSGYPNDHDWLLEGSRAPEIGEIISNHAYATTLKKIASQGKDGFYKGEIAEKIVETVQRFGGMMTMEDLANHTTDICEPISLDYHDLTIWEIPPTSQGITTLMALGIIEALEQDGSVDFSKIELNSADYFHIVTEALRLAFADTKQYIADPNAVPTERLLNKEYLRERSKLIHLEHKNDDVCEGYPDTIGNTTCFSVIDKDGNACSFMLSIGLGFIYLPSVRGTGISLQDRGGFFSLDKNHPNCIGPNKKPFHTLMPALITRKDDHGEHKLEATLGIMGLFMQHQGQVQYILNLKHYLSNPQKIMDLPRMSIVPAQKGISLDYNNSTIINDYKVLLEGDVPELVVSELEKKGHLCKVVPMSTNITFGYGQMILSRTDPNTKKKVLVGGCDPRTDGQVCGW